MPEFDNFTLTVTRIGALHRQYTELKAERGESFATLGEAVAAAASRPTNDSPMMAKSFAVHCMGEALSIGGQKAMSAVLDKVEDRYGIVVTSWVSACWRGIMFPGGGCWMP